MLGTLTIMFPRKRGVLGTQMPMDLDKRQRRVTTCPAVEQREGPSLRTDCRLSSHPSHRGSQKTHLEHRAYAGERQHKQIDYWQNRIP